ncbi:hypothetical protein [Aquisphaera insulae]|uniref:hypothetical protein n=1 Tax=Aquisphaera insulae TaxID=2712864 RepID=UPI00196A57F4|nr:hypothetical protein [Aquisphaera insulae]
MPSLHAPYPRLHERPDGGSPRPSARCSARLSLFINGSAYQVRPLVVEEPGVVRAFRLRKFDGTEYDVVQAETGIACECPDFVFHRAGIDPGGCKHVKALVSCGLMESPLDEQYEAEEIAHPRPRPLPGDAVQVPATDRVAANGQPTTFLEIVEHEALGFRAWGTPVGGFLANQLDRVAQLIRWTGAESPEVHEDRMEVHDREFRDRLFDQGYQDGLEAGRREAEAWGLRER